MQVSFKLQKIKFNCLKSLNLFFSRPRARSKWTGADRSAVRERADRAAAPPTAAGTWRRCGAEMSALLTIAFLYIRGISSGPRATMWTSATKRTDCFAVSIDITLSMLIHIVTMA